VVKDQDSRLDAFTLPRNGAQAAGCTKPKVNLLRKDDLCQLGARVTSSSTRSSKRRCGKI